MILSVLLGLGLAYFALNVVRLELNVRKARNLKVPIARIPFGLNNQLWAIFQPLVWAVLAYLPFPWSSYPNIVRFSHRNWNFQEKSWPALHIGPIWALVSPGGIHVQVSDPDAIHDICMRWREFVRPVQFYRKCPDWKQALS